MGRLHLLTRIDIATTERAYAQGSSSSVLAARSYNMNIGIIGAGMIGETLARRLVQLGHQVAIANSRGPETLRSLASETGATVAMVLEAARSGEIVVITIPE